MNTLDKSLQALDNLLNTLSKDEMDKIIAQVDEMSATGPTIFEYLEKFESQFEDVFNSPECWDETFIPGLNSFNYSNPQELTQKTIEIKHSRKIHFDLNIQIDNLDKNSVASLPIAA